MTGARPGTPQAVAATATARSRRIALGRQLPWMIGLGIAALLPWLLFDWARGHHSSFALSVMSQMGIMIIFALSYNMLMGEAGLLSFCHAVLLGLGGYVTMHVLTAINDGAFVLPMELLPLVGGFAGLGFAIALGFVATQQRAIAFAMITLGLSELIGSAALMFHGFFGGETGVTGDRMASTSLLGLSYGPSIQVYYLVLAWTAIAVALMALLTRTPLGRMANACRDNFERAQFVGYDPRRIRLYQFALSGFFAGLAGSLYAIVYEIVTYDAMGNTMSINVILMAYIGGIGVFWGPIIGAILITLFQGWISLVSISWQAYVGLLFILMVVYAPGGLAGLILLHRPIWEAGRLPALIVPYLRVGVPLLAAVLGFVALVELASYVTIGVTQGKSLTVFGRAIDTASPLPWIAAIALLGIGAAGAFGQRRAFAARWDAVAGQLKIVGGTR
jgi:branched-chain amino acid transport system permease protein